MLEICGGWDDREIKGFNVCQYSIVRRASEPVKIVPIIEQALRGCGLYTRPHEQKKGQLWCPISEAPMATAFANSRFLVPWIANANWVLWMDFCDMLVLRDINYLMTKADPKYAVMVIKHRHEPIVSTKMDGQSQTVYNRKNWSSLILWNMNHQSNIKLTLEDVNTRPGRDLHRFFWLEDDEIGELPVEWNWLVGVNDYFDPERKAKPCLLHYTLGTPELGINDPRWAGSWYSEFSAMSMGGKL